MLTPPEFARLAVVHGTVATVSDPHEIANVMGVEGIWYMINNGKKVPFKFYFGASSCVPATDFETSGARLGPDIIKDLLLHDEIKYLSEMMNFPGVLHHDPVVMQKIQIAKELNKPIDGHAPGLMGEDAKKYIEAGISTDHECFTKEEALEKIKFGMKILIREGSAAKNFEALIDLIKDYPDMVMFCSDDRHPNDLVESPINGHVKRAIHNGYDPIAVLIAARYNPIVHYGLDVGLLRPGDDADIIIVDDLDEFNVLATYIKGEKVAENQKSLLEKVKEKSINNFKAQKITIDQLILKPESETIKVIKALDGQLITENTSVHIETDTDNVVSQPEKDILKLIIVNRYKPAPPAIAFIKGFGIKEGAFASSVAHDSHNIIAVGTSDKYISDAINILVDSNGGISVTGSDFQKTLPLPVAGLMTSEDGYLVAKKYQEMDLLVKDMGSELQAPYMTLSFMALLVIPQLKLSDEGLFDVTTFNFTPLFKV